MTQRGRGTLEINPSRNPFFQTTSSDIGAKVHERAQMDWNRPSPAILPSNSGHFDENSDERVDNKPVPSYANNYGEDFSFLYSRSSDAIGSKVERSSQNVLGQCMDTGPQIRQKKKLQDYGQQSLIKSEHKSSKKNVETILENYTHIPKDENPLYTTSTNEYGRKAPGVATFVADRAYRPQEFSKSFNGIKPKNSSLNTSVTKSNIHPKLDPQFI